MTYFQPVQIKNSGRPVLLNDEHDIIINDSVGLYQNNQRIKGKQNGRIFLTNKRLIYVDNLSPLDSSVSLDLNDIDSIDYQSRFLKRSSRLIIFLVSNKNNQIHNQSNFLNISSSSSSSPSPSSSSYSTSTGFITEWICPICSANNVSNGKITLNSTDLPICNNCGIQMDYNMTKESVRYHFNNSIPTTDINKDDNKLPCPKCTFLNHVSIKYCEMCDTKLPQLKEKLPSSSSFSFSSSLSNDNNRKIHLLLDRPKYIQISFRKTDGSLFFEATKKALHDLKLDNGHFNQNLASINGISVTQKKTIVPTVTPTTPMLTGNIEFMGINGLERYKETQLLNNDILFNNALQDLNKLMSLANSIEDLYKSQNKNLSNEKKQISNNLIETNLTIDRDKFLNQDSFLNELSREIYDFAMLEFKDNEVNNNVLIPLIDFYAMYNKAMRIGTGLISPQELKEACQRFPKLGLNDLKLITLNKRILCLATNDSFDFIKGQILQLLSKNPGLDILKITQLLNDLADQKKSNLEEEENTSNSNDSNNLYSVWTVSIIEEILQSCINNGLLVIDEDLSGIYYYTNLFSSLY